MYGRSPEFGGPVYIKNNDIVLSEALASGSGVGVDNESVKVTSFVVTHRL